MKKFLLLGSIFISLWSKGQTIIGGILTKDSTLSFASSPYLINDDVTISIDKTLTIEPGVVIQLQRNKSIIVEGTLKAIGTASKRITLTPHNATPTDPWGAIVFSANSQQPVFDENQDYINGSILKYVNLSMGGSSNGIIVGNNSSIYIDNSKILNSKSEGVFISGGTLRINESVFDNNLKEGLKIVNWTSGNLTVNKSSFTNNVGAVTIESGNNLSNIINISENDFTNNKGNSALAVIDMDQTEIGAEQINIYGNIFSTNKTSLINIKSLTDIISINCNTMDENKSLAYPLIQINSNQQIDFKNNNLLNYNESKDKLIGLNTSDVAIIEYNNIENSTVHRGTTNTTDLLNVNNAGIYNNNFYFNEATYTINLEDNFYGSIQYNNFIDNGAYEIETIYKGGVSESNASFNYWKGDDPATRIYVGNEPVFYNSVIVHVIVSEPNNYEDPLQNCPEDIVTSIRTIDIAESSLVYPNPTNDFFNIKDFDGQNVYLNIQIINNMGTTVQEINIKPNQPISVSQLASGLYWVNIRKNGRVYNEKLLIP